MFLFAASDYIGGSHICYATFDLDTNTYKGITMLESDNVDSRTQFSQIAPYGKYVYYTVFWNYKSTRLKRIDLESKTKTQVKAFDIGYLCPYATANDIYLFVGTNSAQTTYYKHSLLNENTETIGATNAYYFQRDVTLRVTNLENSSGILYFRANTVNSQPSGMQFLPSPETSNLSNGTIAVIQSQYKNSVKIQDSSNIHTGVDNVYVKSGNNLETRTVFLGDGTNWNIYKNPNNETATVTFDSNGGTTIPPTEVVLGQKLLTKPETTRSGNYIFEAWYLGDEPFDFNTEIIKDITLTAHWLAYEEVDYIESSGTQYVDTGIVMTENIYSVVDFQFVSLDTSVATAGLIGGWGGTGSNSGQLFSVVTSKNAFQFAYGSTWNGSTMPFDTDRHILYMNNNNSECLIDSTVLATSSDVTVSLTDTRTTHLFKSNGGAGTSKARIFSCKLYDNGTLVRNFQPIKIETGEYALVDKVNNKAYRNAGTGEFIGEVVQ